MIDQSLLNSNFIGRDGFRWWIGQIAPIRAQRKQVRGKGWGNRLKVRILGYHPFSKEDLPDDDLPWAGILLPPTHGSGGANLFSSVRLRPGDVVMGFFVDGDNAQVPVIFGAFGRTKNVSQDAPTIGFQPFTGYSERMDTNNATITSEGGEQQSDSQKSNRNLSNKKVDELNKNKKEGELLEKKLSDTVDNEVTVANDCDDNFLNDVASTLDGLISSIDQGTDFLGEVAQATSKIQKMSNSLVSNTMGNLFEKMVPELQSGLDNLYDSILPIGGPSAAIAAQEALIPKVQGLENILECAPGKIVSGLNKTIRDLINEALLSVSTTGVCVAEQFTASLLDGIIDEISDNLDDALGGLSSILSPAFKVKDVLKSSSDLFKSAGAFVGCNQSNNKCVNKVKTFKTGGKPKIPFDVNASFDNVLGLLNSNNSGTPFVKPNCADVSFCGPPIVNIFGGDGIGGAAKAIMGGIVKNTDGLSDVTADLSRTGSIIGVEITDPGASYFTSPPLITFEDPCNKGYGATGEAVIDFNPDSPSYGQITAVEIISVGENYPVSPENDGDAVNSDSVPVGVIDTIILNAGSGYLDANVFDGNVEYDVVIQNGRIISAKPLNNIKIENQPKIKIRSNTGTGALIKPVIGRLPLTPQGEVVQVIDCISPNIKNIVGYVNGKAYFGPYHFHPTRGVKMVGAVHLPIPHEIIYDTPQESFRASRARIGIATTTEEIMTTPTNMQPSQRIGEVDTTTTTPPSAPPSSPPPSSPPPSSPPSGGGGYGGGY